MIGLAAIHNGGKDRNHSDPDYAWTTWLTSDCHPTLVHYSQRN